MQHTQYYFYSWQIYLENEANKQTYIIGEHVEQENIIKGSRVYKFKLMQPELCQLFLKHSKHWKWALNVIKMKCVLWFLFSIQSADYGTTTVAKVRQFTLSFCSV